MGISDVIRREGGGKGEGGMGVSDAIRREMGVSDVIRKVRACVCVCVCVCGGGGTPLTTVGPAASDSGENSRAIIVRTRHDLSAAHALMSGRVCVRFSGCVNSCKAGGEQNETG